MILDRLRAHSGKRQKPSAEVLLGRRQGSWLLGTALLTLAPHVSWLPPWIIALCAALLSWRGLLLWRGKQAPPHLLLLLLTVAAAAEEKTKTASEAVCVAGSSSPPVPGVWM